MNGFTTANPYSSPVFILPFHDLRLGRDQPTTRKINARLPPQVILGQTLLVLVREQRGIGTRDEAVDRNWESTASAR